VTRWPNGWPSEWPGRPRSTPRLVVELPFEGALSVELRAESYEDELRLVVWLLRSRALRQLGMQVYALLDEREREAA
jgi:hypothetical protein